METVKRKCEVVMLSTEKASKLLLVNTNGSPVLRSKLDDIEKVIVLLVQSNTEVLKVAKSKK